MHETTPAPTAPSGITATPAVEQPSAVPADLSAGPPPRSGWLSRLARGMLAVPRYMIRHPGRSLVIALLLLLISGGVGLASVYSWASYHLRKARDAVQHYHNYEAQVHLRACLSVWPNDAETLLLAARVARRNNAHDLADSYLDRYQALRGKDDENLLVERVLVRVERGEVDSVRNYCQSLVQQDDPATPLVLEALGRGYMRLYRPMEAHVAIQEWLKRDPDNPEALLLLAQLYDLQIRMHDAIATYRRALTVDDQLDEARLRLCNALMQLGMDAEAQPHLDWLCKRYPDNQMLKVYLARTEDRAGNRERAEQLIADVLARNPEFAPALFERGKLELRAGNKEEAERLLRRVTQLEPGDAQAWYQLSLALEANGKSEEGRKALARMREIEEDQTRIREIVTVKMQQAPHDPELHYEVGVISLRAGARDEGLRWLHSALKEDPYYAPAHQKLAEYYQRNGDFARAAEHRRKAENKDGGKPGAPMEKRKRS